MWDLERRARVAGIEGLTERLYSLLTPLLAITDEVFAAALALELPDPGTNDRLHLAACAVHRIGVIVSSDRGLDGAPGIQRADPLDAAAVATLLA